MRIRLFSFVALLGALFLESCYTRIANISSPDKNIRVSVSDSIMTVKYSGILNSVSCSAVYRANYSFVLPKQLVK